MAEDRVGPILTFIGQVHYGVRRLTEVRAVVLSGVQFVLVARRGPLAEGLKAVILAVPGVRLAGELEDLSAPPDPGTRDADGVVVDGAVDGRSVADTVAHLKRAFPRAKCIFLAEDVAQHAAAQAAGLPVVFVKGSNPAHIASAVEDIVRFHAA